MYFSFAIKYIRSLNAFLKWATFQYFSIRNRNSKKTTKTWNNTTERKMQTYASMARENLIVFSFFFFQPFPGINSRNNFPFLSISTKKRRKCAHLKNVKVSAWRCTMSSLRVRFCASSIDYRLVADIRAKALFLIADSFRWFDHKRPYGCRFLLRKSIC